MRLVFPVYVCHKATPVTPDSRWNWDPSGDTSTMVARFLVHGFNGKINVTLTSNGSSKLQQGANAGLSIFIDVEYPF